MRAVLAAREMEYQLVEAGIEIARYIETQVVRDLHKRTYQKIYTTRKVDDMLLPMKLISGACGVTWGQTR